MEPILQQLLRRAFAAEAARWEATSPVRSALCQHLGAGPSPALADIFGRFFRMISATAPNAPLLLAALHGLALEGGAPRTARFFATCGGSFDPSLGDALAEAAEADLSRGREEILDFMLSREPADPVLEACPLLLLGAMTAAERFGGGLSLVELGAGGGLRLLLDRYAYRFGSMSLGDSALEFAPGLRGTLPEHITGAGMPKVVARVGLDQAPVDLRDPRELNAVAAWLPPDRPDRLERLRTAAALMAGRGAPELRQGGLDEALSPLLVAAYNAMPPGNTLLLVETLHWSMLSEAEKKRSALAVQTLAAQIQPRKPIAWLQLEPFTPGGGSLELRLHTFGWTDPEDRAVRRLAETDPGFETITWLE